jgi:thioredoxin 1
MRFDQKGNFVSVLVLVFILTAILFSWPANAQNKGTKTPSPAKSTPALVDIGARKCIPCKMMAPILEELKKEYAGVFQVEFIDVWENPGAGEKYGIRSIPTQIFYDASGKEFYRHMGYFSKEQILDAFKKHGVVLSKTAEMKK